MYILYIYIYIDICMYAYTCVYIDIYGVFVPIYRYKHTFYLTGLYRYTVKNKKTLSNIKYYRIVDLWVGIESWGAKRLPPLVCTCVRWEGGGEGVTHRHGQAGVLPGHELNLHRNVAHWSLSTVEVQALWVHIQQVPERGDRQTDRRIKRERQGERNSRAREGKEKESMVSLVDGHFTSLRHKCFDWWLHGDW